MKSESIGSMPGSPEPRGHAQRAAPKTSSVGSVSSGGASAARAGAAPPSALASIPAGHVDVTGTAYAQVACALELLKSGQVITATSELERALEDMRRARSEQPPQHVLEVLQRLKVLASVSRGIKGAAVEVALQCVKPIDLERLSRAQCVVVVEQLAAALAILNEVQR